MGAIAVRIEESIERPAANAGEKILPQGDMALDIEKYIRSERPQLAGNLPEILATIRELEKE
jgi:hypothetical protein